MKKKLTSVAFLITGFVTLAQQDAQFSMNMFNRLSVNPAYAGMNKALCGTLFFRNQWTSFPGAPKTGLLSVDFGEVLYGGVGLTVDQDQLGFDKTLKAKLAYSFHLPLEEGTLGIGLDAGMIQKTISGNFIAPDGTTSSNPGTDLSIPWSGIAATTYDLGFGLYYSTNRLYIGLSSLHLPEQQLSKKESSYDFNYKVARHYFVMAGYAFRLSPQFDLTPSILAKSDASATQLDLNLMAKWKNIIFGGFSYRLSDALVAIVGLETNFTPKITAKFAYSYDATTSAIRNHSSGSHEIMLGFCYKISRGSGSSGSENVRYWYKFP